MNKAGVIVRLPRQPVKFTVYGTPAQQGSMKSLPHKKTGKIVTMPDSKRTKPWKQEVAQSALFTRAPMFERDTPVRVVMIFYFSKPKSVKREAMTVAPDGDKLVRAIFDSLKGIVIADDAQIVQHFAAKCYGDPPRAEIVVSEVLA